MIIPDKTLDITNNKVTNKKQELYKLNYYLNT